MTTDSRPDSELLYPVIKTRIKKGRYIYDLFTHDGVKALSSPSVLELVDRIIAMGFSFFHYHKDNRLHNALEAKKKLEHIVEERRKDREFDLF